VRGDAQPFGVLPTQHRLQEWHLYTPGVLQYRMPVRQLYLQLGRVIGVPPAQSEETGPIRVEDGDRSAVVGILSRHLEWRSNQPYIVVNPNASDLLLERRWPTESVVETISRLVSLGHQVALIGARNELPYVKSLFDRLPPETQSGVLNTAGALTLGEMLALLDGAACVLTNDSGPMHIAVALGAPYSVPVRAGEPRALRP
jgi:ADP-heptose:LPS heptosyltransferase